MQASDVLSVLSSLAPVSFALSYDNVGLLIGGKDHPVSGITVALDITERVIEEAIQNKTNLIVSHHPVIFDPLKRLDPHDPVGKLVYKMIRADLAAICMHTNLDAAQNGVNAALAARLGIQNTALVEPIGRDGQSGALYGIGLWGETENAMPLCDFLSLVKSALSCPGLRYHDASRPVYRVAVGGGSCGDFVYRAKEIGFDTLVTADVKHAHFLAAATLGINLIDAGHFHTENPVTDILYDTLRAAFPALPVYIAENNVSPVSFF